MGIITKMLKETAVYWAPLAVDEFGQPTYVSPVELSVRWQSADTQFEDSEEGPRSVRSTVYVSSDVEVHGVLWLGDLADVLYLTDPEANEGAKRIRDFKKTPNFKATEWLRVAGL